MDHEAIRREAKACLDQAPPRACLPKRHNRVQVALDAKETCQPKSADGPGGAQSPRYLRGSADDWPWSLPSSIAWPAGPHSTRSPQRRRLAVLGRRRADASTPPIADSTRPRLKTMPPVPPPPTRRRTTTGG
ncbi:hypothetical protein GQ55_5G243600 [Panicum hallii var. hallii]|uniref:Uncharacterized protein n=1 Tax=Panicum hallii var. hallii TaxID=1504633 RepID=A0A2T7DJT0_9POAL|nr:hypothetical protein GQ55_5G243600 [Panicum hallii var. hallii]